MIFYAKVNVLELGKNFKHQVILSRLELCRTVAVQSLSIYFQECRLFYTTKYVTHSTLSFLHTVTDTCSNVHKANISYWSKLELSFKIYICKISNGIEN